MPNIFFKFKKELIKLIELCQNIHEEGLQDAFENEFPQIFVIIPKLNERLLPLQDIKELFSLNDVSEVQKLNAKLKKKLEEEKEKRLKEENNRKVTT